MSLERLLRDLSINFESKDVVSVLSEIRKRFEERDSDKPVILCRTAAVFRIGSVSWLFPESSPRLRSTYTELVSTFTEHTALPVCDTDGGTLPSTSYKEIPGKALAVGGALVALITRLGEAVKCGDSGAKGLLHTLSPALCVFSVTHLQQKPWTDGTSRGRALELLNLTVTASGRDSVHELLCGSDGAANTGILASIMDNLQPDMTKENWKRNEALKHVFSWLLLQVGRPCLADYLDKVFPPALLISDDYHIENKVLGVHCLHHIVLHVPAAELRQFNRAQVLYDALYNHLYTSEALLIQVVLPCLIDLLSVLEKPVSHSGLPRTLNRHDSVLRLILTHMEMEHKLALRRIYASNLLLFVKKMGVAIARHLKRLERVILGYLEVSDGPEEKARLSILEVLERTIQVAWPRMECRLSVLARSLLRFLVDVSEESLSPELIEELSNRATCCLLLLDHCSRGRLRVELKEVDSSCGGGGLHYGIISCEGCKGFFKRSICNKRVYRCSRDKNCEMSRKQRNRCQYCRLLKCLQMGMNRKAIREDGMPGGRNKSIGPVQEFKDEANMAEHTWGNNGDSDHSSPGNGVSDGNQPSPASTLSSNAVAQHYQFLPHLFGYAAQPRSLYPQSHTLISQLVAAEELAPLGTPMLIEDGYRVTQVELFALLCRLADELLFRQISWIKKLPFFCELSIEDYTRLLSATWQELILLACLTVYSAQILGDLANVTDKYTPSDHELQGFSEDGMEVMEKLIYLFRKFHQLKVSNEEYACMKAINFLNQDIRGLTNVAQLEQLNKRYWFLRLLCEIIMGFGTRPFRSVTETQHEEQCFIIFGVNMRNTKHSMQLRQSILHPVPRCFLTERKKLFVKDVMNLKQLKASEIIHQNNNTHNDTDGSGRYATLSVGGAGGLQADTCWGTTFRTEEWGLKWELEEETRRERFRERNLFDVRRNHQSV
ncbi:Nuclear receptor subfamily 6 group A member 1-A [Bagarius yarrelli]|uniref:Nuclear receptor subfamily 6 group A member 1-A n=1 Tax=Bagarius yarrelli TaxID=175774 RepID=A0A556VCS3_BAGYA|nr:Nuclear receptor subfamily 6 group A member 1-A [Bagarius yarrelli]